MLTLFSSACMSGTILDAMYTEGAKQNPYIHRTYTVVVVGEENLHLNLKIKYIMICVSSFYVKWWPYSYASKTDNWLIK